MKYCVEAAGATFGPFDDRRAAEQLAADLAIELVRKDAVPSGDRLPSPRRG